VKNTIQKIGGVFLAGFLARVPIHSESNSIDLKNGYAAESYSTLDKLDLATAAVLGEVGLRTVGNSHKLIPNSKSDQAPPAEWAFWFNMVCKAADSRDQDRFITDDEAQGFSRRHHEQRAASHRVFWALGKSRAA